MAEIQAYTFEELQELHLPGYKCPANVYDVLSPETDWTVVTSASEYLVDEDTSVKKVLTGERQSSTHNQVISTMTMQTGRNYRLIRKLAEYRQKRYAVNPRSTCTLSEEAPESGELGTVISYEPNPQPLSLGHGTLSYFVGELNTYKLGLPTLLEAQIKALSLGSASLCSIHIGFSDVSNDSDDVRRYEPLVMLAAAVNLSREAAALIPAENDKYKYLGWTEDSRTFAEDVRTKNVLNLAPAAGNVALWDCAYGLCLKTTSSVSERADLDGHLALDDPAMLHRYRLTA
jgi:hypothetical protein